MTASRHEVAVVGGGMVGASLGLALGQAGFDVVMVEASAGGATAAEGPFDNRVSAISRSSERLFRHLGTWQAMEGARLAPYQAMEVRDVASGASIRFDSADLGEPDLGCIIENRVVVAALEARIRELDNVTWRRPRQLRRLGDCRDGVRTLTLDQGEVEAALVVGADGAHSPVRRLAGIADGASDYGHHALVATVRLEEPHGQVARQWFLKDGPVALLPLPEAHTCSIVWSTVPEVAAELASLEEGDFLERLGEATQQALGRPLTVTGRAVFPLVRRHAERYVGPCLALVGDAAHTIHPLAGQGVNLGLLDAAALTEVLAAARDAGRPLGGEATLRRYERWRRGHNLLMQGAMMGFKELFGLSFAPARVVRGLGMGLLHRASPAKNAIIRQAMGLSGDLPVLCRADTADPAAPLDRES